MTDLTRSADFFVGFVRSLGPSACIEVAQDLLGSVEMGIIVPKALLDLIPDDRRAEADKMIKDHDWKLYAEMVAGLDPAKPAEEIKETTWDKSPYTSYTTPKTDEEIPPPPEINVIPPKPVEAVAPTPRPQARPMSSPFNRGGPGGFSRPGSPAAPKPAAEPKAEPAKAPPASRSYRSFASHGSNNTKPQNPRYPVKNQTNPKWADSFDDEIPF